MYMSKMLISTMKEDPKEAEINSHKFLLRAGMIQKISSGIYNYMPLGLRVLKRVESIIREEMNKAGCIEVLTSNLIPAELWEKSGRWDDIGALMFRLKDRNERSYCLGPSHEETFAYLAKTYIKSHRQLPICLYQIQSKFRDELRPQYGLMRSRQFTMKDAYTFDKDEAGLDKAYNNMYKAYKNTFARLGLDARAVEADTGIMGGNESSEFMVTSDFGQDEVVFCDTCEYASNMEKASCLLEETNEDEELLNLENVHTPNARNIKEVSEFFGVEQTKIAKTLIYVANDKTIAVVLRGDRQANDIKIINKIENVNEITLADDDVIRKVTKSAVGFAGPKGIDVDYLLVDQEIVNMKNLIVGGNKTDYHLKNVNYQRDFEGIIGDFRKITENEKCPKCENGKIYIKQGVEVGHIFKQRTKYSKVMNAMFLDENGESKPLLMGAYGIGVDRTIAAIIEQNHDENGIIWPICIAPFEVIIVPVNTKDEQQLAISKNLYDSFKNEKVDVILDDRDMRGGAKFKDADLIGIPIRIVVGKKSGSGLVELKYRNNSEIFEVEIKDVVEKIKIEICNTKKCED